MSKKSLGGAAYFEAMGRRSVSLNLPLPYRWVYWPNWARIAYIRGRDNQTICCIPKGVIVHKSRSVGYSSDYDKLSTSERMALIPGLSST